MHRFFVPAETLRKPEVQIRGEVAHQITRVLRMRPGDEVLLLDGLGYEYRVRLLDFGKDAARGEVLEKRAGKGEPGCAVDLYLALLNKPDKFEWALQKCTELGVTTIVPIVTERSVGGVPGQGKRERLERIIQEAAEQSGRCRLLSLGDVVTLQEAFEAEEGRIDSVAEDVHIAIMPTLGAERSLKEIMEKRGTGPESVSIFIGPEGGFTDDEVDLAYRAGVQPVSLGHRTLRAETAAVATLAAVMYELGEMGGNSEGRTFAGP
jgi:16S rRNA (uracil1498-N3)-methyltransferase